MDVFQNCMLWAVIVLTPLLITGIKPDPPQNLQIYVSENSVNVTWTITQSLRGVRLCLFDSKDKRLSSHKDILWPTLSWEIRDKVTPCEAYKIQAQSFDLELSNNVEQVFWFTEKKIFADINNNATLTWKTELTTVFAVKAPKDKTNIYQVDGGGNVVINTKTSKYSVFTTNSTSVQDIQITVMNVNPDDGGIYKTESLLSSRRTTAECVLLIITAQPTKPLLLQDNNNSFVGENISLTCKSEAQRWPKGVFSSLNYVFFGFDRGGNQDGNLRINNLSKSDKGANISCQAVDDLGKMSERSDNITLDVFYGPEELRLLPPDRSVTIPLGDKLGPIMCSAKCYPECSISWKMKRTSKKKSTTGTLSVNRTTKNDAGIYQCTATNPKNKSKSLRLNVTVTVTGKPTKPALKLKNQYPFAGDDIVLTCKSKVRRWPKDISSSLTYTFFGFERGKQRGNKLIINNVAKSDHGANISCQAVDDLDQMSERSDILTLDVLYGPEDVKLTPMDVSVTQIEGTQLGPITCSAKCHPKCQISWKKEISREINSNGTLLVKSITKDNGGIYQCTATNPKNESKRLWLSVNVTVHYPPSIRRSQVIVKGLQKKNSTSYVLTEGDPVQVKFTIDSNPNVNLTLISPGLLLNLLDFNQSNQTYAIQLPPLVCENSGLFLIEAKNGIGKTAKWYADFDIQCKPKEVMLISEKIGTQIGAKESISVLVVSNPKPIIEWNTPRINIGSWSIQQIKGSHQYNATSTVTIREESDIGLYTIRIRNNLGLILSNVTFIPKGKPEKPSNFSCRNVTFNQATLSWTAEFDGGGKQNFIIYYKIEKDDSWKSVEIPADNTRRGTKIHYILGELLPRTSYDVDLVASNEYGSSNVSLRFTTGAESVMSSSLSPEITYISGGTVLVLLVLATFGFIIFKKKRKERDSSSTNADKDTKNRNKKEQDNENIPGVSNAEYACVKKQTSNGSNKSAQQDKENAEYAVVDKTHKNKVFDDESLYANQANESLPIINTEVKRPGRSVNKDGLIYIEVAFAKTKSDGGPMIIHGDKDRTTYVEIDFTKKGEPLPDNNED